MTNQICNAIIQSALIEIEDHGLLSAWLKLDFGGYMQGFGGYGLAPPSSSAQWPYRANFAGVFIMRTLEVVGVSRWDLLPGKSIRVNRLGNKIIAIGHVIKDDWFNADKEMKKLL